MENLLNKRLANFNSSSYNDGIRGQCVWYVRGRAKEKLGVDTKIRGNANKWYEQAIHKDKPLKANSIACFNGGSFGHVIFIEAIKDGNVYFTEANGNGDNILDKSDGILQKSTVDEFMKRKNYQGCIYLEEYKKSKPATKKPPKNAHLTEATTTANLNYRSSPNGKIIGTLPLGSKVYLTNKKGVLSGNYIWKEAIINGRSYYVAQEYLRFKNNLNKKKGGV